ncbi:hypothetical protein, partial [Desulfoluna spongiiphila]|uniref:hypothetical protein n=1 Tax=Desulfoluna spongiiphila TaxID=419481 RepID=UPI0011144852
MAFVANPSKMIEFKQPIAVYFVWHPDDASIVKPLVNFCYERFQRDTSKPFSRSMNLPVFFRTSVIDEIPSAIESKSEKTLVFCFSSKSITGRKKWRDYYKTFFTSPYHIVPVAIEQCGFNIGGKFERLNFVRLMDFDKKYFDISFFISVTHEIIRFAFMKGGTTSGDISALKLFLSHTKYDSWAVNTAVSLKRFIDETSIHRFFDVHDIHAAHDFGTEIDDGIK